MLTKAPLDWPVNAAVPGDLNQRPASDPVPENWHAHLPRLVHLLRRLERADHLVENFAERDNPQRQERRFVVGLLLQEVRAAEGMKAR